MKINIDRPKRFYQFSNLINIEYVKQVSTDVPRAVGAWIRPETIHIQLEREATPELPPVSKEDQDKILLHEMVHCILWQMKGIDSTAGEPFVNVFSNLLYQALNTLE